MELLVIGAVAALGYKLTSGSGGAAPTSQKRQRESLPRDPGLRAAQSDAYVRANTPTIYPPPDRQPVRFYRSERQMNTSTSIKDRQLALFSGADDGVQWRPKGAAPAPFFKPGESRVLGGVGSNGSGGNDEMRRRIPQLTGRQNSVLPFAQQRVGPAVGEGPDVIASGGFQQDYRLPDARLRDALGSYKMNTLPGAIIPGAGMPQRTADTGKATGDGVGGGLLYTREPQPGRFAGPQGMAGGGGYRATFEETYASNSQAASKGEGDAGTRFGVAAGAVGAGATHGAQNLRCNDRFHEFPMLGVSGMPAAGAYSIDNPMADGNREIFTRREQVNEPFAGFLNGQSLGVNAAVQAPQRTLKEFVANTPVPLGIATNPIAAANQGERDAVAHSRVPVGVVPQGFGREIQGRNNIPGELGEASLRNDNGALQTLREPGHACMPSVDGPQGPGQDCGDGIKLPVANEYAPWQTGTPPPNPLVLNTRPDAI